MFKEVFFYSQYKDGKERYFLVGTVVGALGRGLPDIYNFIGNEKVSIKLTRIMYVDFADSKYWGTW